MKNSCGVVCSWLTMAYEVHVPTLWLVPSLLLTDELLVRDTMFVVARDMLR